MDPPNRQRLFYLPKGEINSRLARDAKPGQTLFMTNYTPKEAFDPDAPAHDMVAALKASDEKKRLLILGANWCPDAKAFAGMLEIDHLADFINSHFQPVIIDVGRYDHNMDIPARFGLTDWEGLPSLMILDAQDRFLNKDTYNMFRNARERHPSDIVTHLIRFAAV